MDTAFRGDEFGAFRWMGFRKRRNFTGYVANLRLSTQYIIDKDRNLSTFFPVIYTLNLSANFTTDMIKRSPAREL